MKTAFVKSIVCVAALAFLALSGCAAPQREMQGTVSPDSPAPPQWEANGIKVERIKPIVAGMKLDLRYRITDPDKARNFLKQTTPLSLIDQASGTVMTVPNTPTVGKLRNVPNPEHMDRVYWMLFDNPGMKVKHGSKVTLVIGDVRIKDITVE